MKKVKVGVFSWYFSKNRDAVFSILSESDIFDFTFLSGAPPNDIFVVDSDHKNYKFKPIKVFEIKIPRSKNSITYRVGSISALLKKQYDVYIMTNNILGLDIWISVIIGKILQIPIIIWGQGLSRPPSNLRIFLRYHLTKLAKAAVYYTEGGKNYWVNKGINSEKLFVAYNSLNTDLQSEIRDNLSPTDIEEFKKNNNLSERILVTFIGRLIPEKKPKVFLQIVQELKNTYPNILGILIGDGPEREKLEESSKSLGISDNLLLLGAVYDENITGKYLLSSLAVIIPAYGGLAIQHAAVYGTPVVIGDLPDSHGPEAEMIKNNFTGIYCSDEDILSFSNAIKKIEMDRYFKNFLSTNLKAAIQEKYNSRRMAEGFLNAIKYSLEN